MWGCFINLKSLVVQEEIGKNRRGVINKEVQVRKRFYVKTTFGEEENKGRGEDLELRFLLL
jgi:hypothetical protein